MEGAIEELERRLVDRVEVGTKELVVDDGAEESVEDA